MDYIGTRLHAGIRALNMGRRTLVIAVDNRARAIGIDTGLPVMESSDLHSQLKDYINSETTYSIHLPLDNIAKWRKQWD